MAREALYVSTALVSTEWLEDNLGAEDLRIIDASYALPHQNRDVQAEYEAGHIPGAVRMDIDRVADTTSALPHMLPSPEIFAARAGALGIGDGDRVIVYDSSGMALAAARVWWMLRMFGHGRTAVLNGGLPKWKIEARALETGPVEPVPRTFTPRFRPELVRRAGDVLAATQTGREQIVDVRDAARFAGEGEEVWPGRRKGHIPGSLNLPFTELIDPELKTLKDRRVLRRIMQENGVRTDRPVVASCGSGVTACMLALALHVQGVDEVAVYDGSWAEWGLREDLPVKTGPAPKPELQNLPGKA